MSTQRARTPISMSRIFFSNVVVSVGSCLRLSVGQIATVGGSGVTTGHELEEPEVEKKLDRQWKPNLALASELPNKNQTNLIKSIYHLINGK